LPINYPILFFLYHPINDLLLVFLIITIHFIQNYFHLDFLNLIILFSFGLHFIIINLHLKVIAAEKRIFEPGHILFFLLILFELIFIFPLGLV
jgi:hypothetical protein